MLNPGSGSTNRYGSVPLGGLTDYCSFMQNRTKIAGKVENKMQIGSSQFYYDKHTDADKHRNNGRSSQN